MTLKEAEEQAIKELGEEEFRRQVDEAKARIIAKRLEKPLWQKIFPYKITIERL